MASVAASRQQVQPTLCRLSKRPLVQRPPRFVFDSAEYFLFLEGKQPTDGITSVRATEPTSPTLSDRADSPNSKLSRLGAAEASALGQLA